MAAAERSEAVIFEVEDTYPTYRKRKSLIDLWFYLDCESWSLRCFALDVHGGPLREIDFCSDFLCRLARRRVGEHACEEPDWYLPDSVKVVPPAWYREVADKQSGDT